MRGVLVAAMLLVGLGPTAAALPPQYQREAELHAVISSGVVDALGGVEIDKVEYVGYDLYRVTSGNCHVDVKIVDVPLKEGEEMMAGPRRFTTAVGEMVCE